MLPSLRDLLVSIKVNTGCSKMYATKRNQTRAWRFVSCLVWSQQPCETHGRNGHCLLAEFSLCPFHSWYLGYYCHWDAWFFNSFLLHHAFHTLCVDLPFTNSLSKGKTSRIDIRLNMIWDIIQTHCIIFRAKLQSVHVHKMHGFSPKYGHAQNTYNSKSSQKQTLFKPPTPSTVLCPLAAIISVGLYFKAWVMFSKWALLKQKIKRLSG